MAKPLTGVKVVEYADFIAASTAGRFLADLGADVIKVESAKGDPLRSTAPSEGRPLDMYENTTWDLENANKRCISLNLRSPEGMKAFHKLLENADVMITNRRVNVLQKMGLDYDTLKQQYPKLVYGICTGYGEYGPDKDLPGFDFTAFFARGGYFDSLRQRGTVPFNGVPGLGDHNVGMNLAAGILAALYQAKQTGKGEKVETSLFESAIFNMGMMIQASNYEGIAQQYPIDVRNSANPFNAAFRTKDDRFIQICTPQYDRYYKAFMTALGREDIAESDKYFPILKCQEAGLTSEVYDIVMEAFGKRTVEEWKIALKEADIPYSLCQNWMEIRNDKQAEANDCFYDMTYSNGNTRRLVRMPVKFAEMGVPDYKPGPLIGEHGVQVMKEMGYSDEEIAKMLESGDLFVWKDERK
ncbi:MAG: CaiB/BaiF CoA-transferase family protein [Eubacteriales bacterium]|nr:CaiB/BaiF CoA-transferase family protein [Eubacteriales bacterium]